MVEVSILIRVLPAFVKWKLGLIVVSCSALMMLHVFWEICSLLLMGNELLAAGWLEVSCLVSDGRMRFHLVVRSIRLNCCEDQARGCTWHDHRQRIARLPTVHLN